MATQVLRNALPPLTLCSDSGFFVDGYEKGPAATTAARAAHADVWRRFWKTFEDFGGRSGLQVIKVKGHCSQGDVDAGRTTREDKWGNDKADEAAKKGARLHPSDVEAGEKEMEEKKRAREAAIWLAKFLASAARTGRLPPKVTRLEKASQRKEKAKQAVDAAEEEARLEEERLQVEEPTAEDKDRERVASNRKKILEGAHASHQLYETGGFFFCGACGRYASSTLRELRDQCAPECSERAAANGGNKRRRLLAGFHPDRPKVFLGEPQRRPREA